MKTILNPTGGRPIKNEDVELIEQFVTMYNDLFGRINAASNEFIISGCDISGSDVSAGFIYYDGNICTFAGATSVSFPLAMEKADVESAPREFYDSVTKNSLNTVTIAAQVGGGFSLSSSTPRLDEFMLRKATTAETDTPTGDDTALTPLGLRTSLTNSIQWQAASGGFGVVEKASDVEAQAGTDQGKYVTPYALQQVTSTITRAGVTEKATTAEAEAGTADKNITADLLLPFTGGLLTTVLDIGSWNMDSTVSVNVAHGLTQSKIRDVSVLIRRDDDVLQYPLIRGGEQNDISVGVTNIQLTRATGGLFDSTNFDTASYNRGWVIIKSIP